MVKPNVHMPLEKQAHYTEEDLDEPDFLKPDYEEPTTRPNPTDGHPLATATSNADEVISPHPPFKRVNIAGFKSGQLARDPYNQKIFRIP